MRRARFLLLFALSGAAALIYEVVWTRLLTLEIGHGLAAASTVLAAFMGGLAGGAALGGRIGQQLSPAAALRAYALLEAGIAGVAVLLPLLLAGLRPLLAALYDNGEGGWAYGTLRIGASLLLLAVPAAGMGATFPLASRWATRHAATLAQDAGRLYTANTLGAAIGALAAGFVLLPSLGLLGATLVGVALNVAAAGGAWSLARLPVVEGASRAKGRKVTAAVAETDGTVGRPWVAAAALGITGFASLSLQVSWTRLLASILGPTTYAFSAVVAVFIFGIALGSAAGTRLARRTAAPATWLAVMVALSGGMALASAAAVDWTLMQVAHAVAAPAATFSSVLLREWILTTGLLLPLATTFGAAFPLALAVAARTDDTMVTDLGLVYAVNTLGAILGALLAGFVLVPWLGLHDTIRLVAALTALTAGLLAAVGGPRPSWAAAAAGLVVLAATAVAPGWDPLLLSSGAYKYAASLRGPDLRTALTAGHLAYYREGATATVAVRQLAGTTSMAIDGKVDASDAADMLTQRLLAHLPLLLHPAPRTAAILGLGSGVTLGSALTHGLDRATVLEISPEVVEASRFFDHKNHRALADPRTRLIVGDGRTHLLLSDERYDVIVSEPSNPWMAGIASLFTREFFETARDRLAPGGVLCQWAHTYDISDGDLRSIVATFLSVFPNGSAWLVGEADVLLIGSLEPLAPRLDRVSKAWQRPGVAADLAEVGASEPVTVLSSFLSDGEALRRWAGDAPLQTDNRARLEFSGPRSIFGLDRPDNEALVRGLAAASPRPAAVARAEAAAGGSGWRAVGEMLAKADAYNRAFEAYARALASAPGDTTALEGLVRAAVPVGRTAEARALLARLAQVPENDRAALALSRLLAAEGQFDQAAQLPFQLLQRRAGHPEALAQLASVMADVGDPSRLAPVVARLRVEAPDSADTHYYAATLAYLQQRPDIAAREAELAMAADAGHGRAANLLGASLAALGERDRARTAFQAALAADARDPATYANLATLELDGGNPDAARRWFAEALTLDPDNEGARQGLLSLLGRP